MTTDHLYPTTIREARTLYEDALHAGNLPRIHPNGFIQLDAPLVPNLRLHVWPALGVIPKQATDSPIHDHKFDMKSHVVKGELHQVLYEFDLCHEGTPTHEIHMAQYTAEHQSVLAGTGVLVRQREVEAHAIKAGEEYIQPAFTFHESLPWDTPLVTLMVKQRSYEGNPRVMCPVGQDPDNEFERATAMTPDSLYSIIEKAIS